MKFVVKKIITLIVTLLLISVLTFAAFSVIPGDAALAKLGTNATPEKIEELREEMGLNDPVPVRYFKWLGGAVRGDFGHSYQYSNYTVAELLGERMLTTVILAVMSLILIVIIGLPLGFLCARYAGRWLDNILNNVGQVFMAIPGFFLGILITYLFGIILNVFQPGAFVFPTENFGGCIAYLVFPAIAIAIPKIAMVARFLRNSMLGEVRKDYVRTAYSKGNPENRVLMRHVFKNGMIPVITFLGMVI
ncbi:MAG: ABC transporter permease, partial [Lachnospiraceae bacterium]|nr:ABC transporter permease [Lachnospiraceae bacterium]